MSGWSVHGFGRAYGPARWGRGLRARILASLGLFVGGSVFALLYLGFWATRFAWYQNLVVLVVTGLVVFALVAAMWIAWGMSLFRHLTELSGPGERDALSPPPP